MTGPELRALMKLRRIKTAEAAHALDVHPQTIRNLWLREEVPRLYLLALAHYSWALGWLGWDGDGTSVSRETKPMVPPIKQSLLDSARREGAEASRKAGEKIEKKESVWSRLS